MKKTCIGVLGCIMLVLIAGCGKTDDVSNVNLQENKECIAEDNTSLLVEEAELQNVNENQLYNRDIINYQIFTQANSEAALKNLYYSIDDFIESDSSDAVVKGNVVEIEYVYIDGCTYSKLTVDVENVYKGKVEKTITVYEDGGYTRLSEEKEQIEAHIDLSQYSEEEMNNLLIDHTFMGAEHSNIGDTVILFLKSNEGTIMSNSYRINCSVYGRYKLSGENYIRPEFIVENDNPEKNMTSNSFNEFEVTVPQSVLEDKLSHLN
ncbi:MAG: hypothetical protein Q4D51_10595 [Eubacteriales bacterium]|nr:hypothetical protein [Eubacteriales bacterium]